MAASPPLYPLSDNQMNQSSSSDDENTNARHESDIRECDEFAKCLRQPREHKEAQQMENIDYYYMPTDKSDKTSKHDRYHEDNRYSQAKANDQSGKHFEQKKWEDEVIHRALPHLDSLDKEAKSNQSEYDYILDQEIEFVQLPIPGVDELLQNKDKSKINEHENEYKYKDRILQEVPKTLPIYRFRHDLMKAMREHQILIIEGETESGKTTQLTQYLVEERYCEADLEDEEDDDDYDDGAEKLPKGKKKEKKKMMMSCTQPCRVAEEINVKLDHEVGYSMRFGDCSSERTIIKYMTD
ncbi:unnamed protein product, partial [Rotaria sp. Silwood1]